MRGVSEPDLSASAAYGSFQGSMFLPDRGYVMMTRADSLREVDTYSRTELDFRACDLYNNMGLGKRIVDGIARMICGTGLQPHPMTEKKEWNKRILQLWNERCGSKNTFDLARRFDCDSAQAAIMRCVVKRGDAAVVLARDDSKRLRAAIFEGNQIGPGANQGKGWYDGVQLDRHNAALAFSFTGKDVDGNLMASTVPAQNVLHVARFDRIGQVRGVTWLAHAANKMRDIGEINAATTKGIKVASQIAYVIERQLQQGPQQIAGGPGALLPPKPTRQIQTPSGDWVSLEKFLSGSEAWGLEAGQTFKTVQSTNPHPNVEAHKKELIRDIAAGTNYSYEILWNMEEMGGANTRFINADAQSQIEVDQEMLVKQFLCPWYVAWVMDMITAGEIEDPGPDWYVHGWLPPARLTVDFGRDGKLYIEQYKRGMITLKSLYGFTGNDAFPQVDQYLDERQYIVQGVIGRKITEEDGTVRSMTMDEAFPELKQGGFPATAEDITGAIDDQQTQKTQKKAA